METMNHVHRLESQRPLRGHPRRGRVRGLGTATPIAVAIAPVPDLSARCRAGAGAHARAPPSAAGAGLLLPEGGGGADRHADAPRALGARVHDRHRRALLETYTTWREIEQRYGLAVEVHDALSLRTASRGPRSAAAASRRSPRSTAPWRPWRAGSPACVASRRPPERPRRSSNGTQRRRCGRPTRWPTGATRTCGATSAKHDLPYNPLHDRGYASIGCVPCTPRARAVRDAGRTATRSSAGCTSRPADAPAATDASGLLTRHRSPGSSCSGWESGSTSASPASAEARWRRLLLIIVIGVQPVVAVGTARVYGAVTTTLGGWRHLRKGHRRL